MDPAAQRTALWRTAGYLCVEWTVGAAMGTMVGGPAPLARQRRPPMGGHHHARADGGACSGWGPKSGLWGESSSGVRQSPANLFGHPPCKIAHFDAEDRSVVESWNSEGKAMHNHESRCRSPQLASSFIIESALNLLRNILLASVACGRRRERERCGHGGLGDGPRRSLHRADALAAAAPRRMRGGTVRCSGVLTCGCLCPPARLRQRCAASMRRT